MLAFLSEYWVYLVVLVVVVILAAVVRGVIKFLRDGGGAFRLSDIQKNSEPNKAALKEKSKALLQDADMICEVQGDRVAPSKEDLMLFRRAVGARYKVAMFLIPESTQVVYFFCKTEAGLKRRFENLMPNVKSKSNRFPYLDPETGKKLKFPK
ncbi:MAG: hypothetical protein LBR60_02380 [Fibrobacter sp.]|jgi:hypothetical protein|nr:hypothetical protein [Fibrobacter sp.]